MMSIIMKMMSVIMKMMSMMSMMSMMKMMSIIMKMMSVMKMMSLMKMTSPGRSSSHFCSVATLAASSLPAATARCWKSSTSWLIKNWMIILMMIMINI